MKKFLIFSSITLGITVIILYAAFLIAPFVINSGKFVDLDTYKPEIQKLVKENSKLSLEYSKIKVYTTPMLSVGAIINDIEIKLPDDSTFLKTSEIKGGIALPSLLTLTVKTAKCHILESVINLDIVNNEQYKIVKVVEDIINENNAKPKTDTVSEYPDIVNKIRVKVPSVKITNYKVKVSDLKNNHKLSLEGEELTAGFNSANNVAKLKTDAKLYSDENKNIDANINISTSIPKFEAKDDDIDPEEKISLPFINPVTIYQTYDLKTNVDSRLRIRQTKNGDFSTYGYLNVDDLSLKLSDIRLPESFLHAKFQGKTVEYESNIYAPQNEKISLNGFIKSGKHPKMRANIVSDKIHFENLLKLSEGLLDSLNIKNNLASIKAGGYLVANANIKTNFKKLKSEGIIEVKDGEFINPIQNIGIKDIKANLIFENNALNIKDTSAIINGSKLTAEGKIDNNSNADIKIDADNLSLPALYRAFAPNEIKREFLINSAILTAHVDIKGRLNYPVAKLKTKLSNLSVSDRKKTMFVSNKTADITFEGKTDKNGSTINGKIQNEGFIFNMPQAKTKAAIEKITINLDNDNISISPFDILYNSLSKITVKGDIKNYTNEPEIDILASGAVTTQNIKQSLGKEISHFIPSKGSIPAKVSIKGDMKKQNILAQIYSDSNNFITPVNLSVLSGKPAIMQANVEIKGNRIKIKDSGLYKKASNGFSEDLQSNTQSAEKIVDLTAIVEREHLNLLKLSIPKELSGNIAIFKKSSFTTKGKITANGNFDRLNFGGDLKINNIKIPEILTSVRALDLDLAGDNLNLKAKEINLNNSKINASLKADLKPAKIFKISNIDVNSDLIDVDKAMAVSNNMVKYMPQPAPAKSTKTAAAANIPLAADGKFNIKKIKSGNILISDAAGNILIKNNNLIIKNLTAKAFEGDIKGDVIVNLINSLITAKLEGKNVDADKMLKDAANMKDTISGTASFKTNISLKGATYLEQVKSLKGTVDFHLKDGQYGPFAKLENFFLAENVRNNPIFANTIGAILTPIATIDSSHYEDLVGHLNFKNGKAYLKSITSRGDILCILIKGDMDLVKNILSSNVKVRLASSVSDSLGPLAVANPVTLVKKTPGLNIATAKLFTLFTQVVTESEYKQIPDFSEKHSDANATKFQIILNGDVAKPLKLVKSFKWLALQKEMDAAQEFSTNYIKEQQELAKQELVKKLQQDYEQNNKLKVGVEKVLQMDTTAPEVKKVLIEETIKQKAQEMQKAKEEQQNKIEEAKAELLQKTQEKIEAQNKKRQEQIKSFQDDLKSKIQSKIPQANTVEEQTATEQK